MHTARSGLRGCWLWSKTQHQGSDFLSLVVHLEAILCLDKGAGLDTRMVEELKVSKGEREKKEVHAVGTACKKPDS